MVKRLAFALAALLLLPAPGLAQHWVGSWAASQQIPEPNNALRPEQLTDMTLRQLMRVTIGGPRLRIRLANTFGAAPLRIDSVHIARTAGGDGASTLPGGAAVTFAGRADVVIPAGAEISSDPVAFALPPLATVAVTMHVADPPAQQTSHPGSRATSYYAKGDFVSAPELANATPVDHWFQIEAVDVGAMPIFGAVAVLGDSITDGHGATTNGNDRWPDALARRLQASDAYWNVGVANKGIGGGRVLLDGLGPSALARFDRDVLAPARVKWLIVLEGINDLSVLTRDAPATADQHAAMVRELIAAYQQMIARAHDHGERGRPPRRERLDPRPRPFRRRDRLRRHHARPRPSRRHAARLRFRRPSASGSCRV
jgi:hypothetical protein